MPEIDILIAAYGPGALDEISRLSHPEYPGVRYVVSWQKHQNKPISEIIESRKDFHIFREESVGLCNNRNALLEHSVAPFVLISDADIEYEPHHFESLLKAWKLNLDCHFLSLKYSSKNYPKNYPDREFNIKYPPKGYFVTSMELSFNMAKIRKDYGEGAVFFNPAYGVNGTVFDCGEEDILIDDILKKGMKGKFIPEIVCINTQSTTADRIGTTRRFIETKGSVIRHIKPMSWIGRMMTHAWRASKANGKDHIPFFTYCRWWISGAFKSIK